MHIYGLTGGIATGKSTVSRALGDLGCHIIDADVIAREVVEPGKPSWKTIVGHFGVDVLRSDGQIDRPKLAKMIFEDRDKRQLLNVCTHPYIQKAMLWEVIRCFLRGERFVVVVSPLLFESGRFLWLLKRTIVVTCSHQQQLERLMDRDHLTEAEALQRLEAQIPLSEKCRRADIVIDNSRDRDSTHQEVLRVYKDLRNLSSYRWIVRWTLLIALIVLGFFVYSLISPRI